MTTTSPVRQLRVLILDDDLDMASTIRDLIEKRGHTATVVQEIQTAWRAISMAAPDVFLADFHIGADRSDRLLAAIRDFFPGVRCLLVSGSDHQETDHLRTQGLVRAALRKPFHPEQLIALVEG
jgi:DNA-binding NtrC family response regulator